MEFIELVAIIATIQFLFFGVMTGMARGKSGLAAPAMTGDEGFERMYRVQMNTLEILIPFLAALFIAGKYWSPALVAGIGLVYVVGRFVFWRAYVTDPSKRAIGFMMSFLPIAVLSVMAVLGVVLSIVRA